MPSVSIKPFSINSVQLPPLWLGGIQSPKTNPPPQGGGVGTVSNGMAPSPKTYARAFSEFNAFGDSRALGNFGALPLAAVHLSQ